MSDYYGDLGLNEKASNDEIITEEQQQEWHEQDIKDGLY